MKDSKLYDILDLIEEINKVDNMIDLHKDSTSNLMVNQYKNQKLKILSTIVKLIHIKNQKLKLSNFLFKELLTNSDNRSEVMYIIKLFIEKFYNHELKHHKFDQNDSFKKIEDVFM